jgi:Uma2 family endonuclease
MQSAPPAPLPELHMRVSLSPEFIERASKRLFKQPKGWSAGEMSSLRLNICFSAGQSFHCVCNRCGQSVTESAVCPLSSLRVPTNDKQVKERTRSATSPAARSPPEEGSVKVEYMGTTTTRLITVAEFETAPAPEQPGKQELLQGEIIQLAPPTYPHERIVRRLFRLLDRQFTDDDERVGTANIGFQMAPYNWLVPDVSITWPDQRLERNYFQGAPMIAIEVESPTNTQSAFARKVSEYLSHGASEVWLIYPDERNMLIHTKAGKTVITDSYQCMSPEVTIRLADLFD